MLQWHKKWRLRDGCCQILYLPPLEMRSRWVNRGFCFSNWLEWMHPESQTMINGLFWMRVTLQYHVIILQLCKIVFFGPVARSTKYKWNVYVGAAAVLRPPEQSFSKVKWEVLAVRLWSHLTEEQCILLKICDWIMGNVLPFISFNVSMRYDCLVGPQERVSGHQLEG